MKLRTFGVFLFFILVLSALPSCKHSPIISEDDDLMPVDTTDNPVDTMDMGEPCDPDLVYFDLQVLPILQSNCAFSGCHDVATAQDGIVLENYESVMQTADVEAFDLDGSDLYEVITDDDPDDRMPPAPENPLSQEQINLIAQWILQGAQDLECDPSLDCDTTNVTYTAIIRPILDNSCVGCHGGSAPSGNINLETYAGVKAVADDGTLLGAVQRDPGFSPMPQGSDPLPDCNISQIGIWIEAGAPNN